MKFAAIPPSSMLTELAEPRNFHLMLAQICEEDPTYGTFYSRLAARGDHIILDNGAFELGTAVSNETMLKWAKIIQPTEIVLPDTFFEWEQTVKSCKDGLDFFYNHYANDKKVGFIATPQGRTSTEWWKCFDELIKLYGVTTIGINMMALKWFPASGRVTILKEIERRGLQKAFDYHLFGGDRALYEPREIPLMFPWVRSQDTSKPIHLGIWRIKLDPLTGLGKHEYQGRPQNYFHIPPVGEVQLDIIKHNLEVIDKWTNR